MFKVSMLVTALCLTLATPVATWAQNEPPKLSTADWHWVAPDKKKHPIIVKDLGGGVFTFTDQAQQTGTAKWDAAKNRFDIQDGKLAGIALYIPDRKQIVLVTNTGSVALYHEVKP